MRERPASSDSTTPSPVFSRRVEQADGREALIDRGGRIRTILLFAHPAPPVIVHDS